MTDIAAYTAAEEATPALNPEGGSHLPRISRKHRDEAIRVLLDLGYSVSGGQAWRLVREFHEWRKDDARRFVAAEFRLYAQKRGDLIQMRGKRHHEWRTHT